MVQCVDCQHAGRPKKEHKSDNDMMRAGFIACSGKDSHLGSWVSAIYSRSCSAFVEADTETRTKRRDYYAGTLAR